MVKRLCSMRPQERSCRRLTSPMEVLSTIPNTLMASLLVWNYVPPLVRYLTVVLLCSPAAMLAARTFQLRKSSSINSRFWGSSVSRSRNSSASWLTSRTSLRCRTRTFKTYTIATLNSPRSPLMTCHDYDFAQVYINC